MKCEFQYNTVDTSSINFAVNNSANVCRVNIVENWTSSKYLYLQACCEINNPEEASAALQVSNVLSQKILNFNTRSLHRVRTHLESIHDGNMGNMD